ncbi:LysE family transporter [Campylobacter sp. MIT 21-1685]
MGTQNVFILKQGINNNHIFVVCSICFIRDVFLMNLGIFGVGEFLT